MKRILSFAVVFAMLSGLCGFAQVPEEYFAHWTMDALTDSGVEDVSGNALHGVVTGTAVPCEGIKDGALDFQGNSSFSIPSDQAPAGMDAFTLSLWLKTDRYPYSASIPDSWEALLFEKDLSYRLRLDMNGSLSFILNTTQDGWYQKASLYTAEGYKMPLNQWNNIVCVFGGGKLSMYINGKLEAEAEGVGGTVKKESDVPLKIGDSKDTTISRKLDEIQWYNRVLTPQEVKENYDAMINQGGGEPEPPQPTNPPAEDPIYHEKTLFSLGTVDGSMVKDELGNGYDAEVKGQVTQGSPLGNIPVIQLDGASCLEIQKALPESLNAFSVSAAVKISELPKTGMVILGADTEDPALRLMVRPDGRLQFGIATEETSWNQTASAVVTREIIQTGKWEFITAVYTGNSLKLYLNGQLAAEGTQSISGALKGTKETLKVGHPSMSEYFKGEMAFLTFYKDALSDEEATAESGKTNKFYVTSEFENAGPSFEDDSVNHFPARLSGNAVSGNGKNGKGVYLDGQPKSWIEFDVGTAISDLPKLAMGCWVNPDEVIQGKMYPIITKEGTDSQSFHLAIEEYGRVRFTVCSNGQWYTQSALSSKALKSNEWTFVEAMFDRGRLEVYFNGQLESSVTMDNATTVAGSNGILIAGGFQKRDEVFKGSIDGLYFAENLKGMDYAYQVGGNLAPEEIGEISYTGLKQVYIPQSDALSYQLKLQSNGQEAEYSAFTYTVEGEPKGVSVADGMLRVEHTAEAGDVTVTAAYNKDLSLRTAFTLELIPFKSPEAKNVQIKKLSGNTYTVSYDYHDPNGIEQDGVKYQWCLNGKAISGADANTYLAQKKDFGNALSCKVQVTNQLMTILSDPPGTTVTESNRIHLKETGSGSGGFGGGGGGRPGGSSGGWGSGGTNPPVVGEITGGEENSGGKEEVDTITCRFEDTVGHWAFYEINALAQRGIMRGVEEGRFAPEDSMKRSEIAALVSRVAGAEEMADIHFSDVSSGAWYYDDLRKAVASGIMTGDGAVFRPEDTVTREEMAKICVQILKNKGKKLQRSFDLSAFSDADQISDWAEEYVALACANGLMYGNTEGSFEPGAMLSRAEAAVMIYRLTEKE